MENKFKWYIPLSDDELNSIWNNGILTVDANVILDLYRYHENTRNILLKTLKDFKGRLWLSHQAATEFVKNRKKVIVASEGSFRKAGDELSKLRSTFDDFFGRLKENRTVSNTLLDDLNNKTKESIDYVESKIKEEESKHPKFLDEDPVLLELLVLFEGAVGDDFEDKKKEDIKKEAEQRVANKIPPGYQDDNKEGEGAYGDYYLWRQVLEQAKKENKPIIFVTSERKDDWWERISGKTTGSRQELMKESMEFSG